METPLRLNVRLLLLPALLVLTLAQSCSRNDLVCTRGNGELETETRQLASFDALATSGNFDVTIVQGEGPIAVVTAESNLLQHIETKVDRGTLQLNTVNDQCISPQERVRIEITVPSLAGVLLSGSGTLTSDTFLVSTFNAELTGSGSIDLRLTGQDVTATVGGSGQMVLAGSTRESSLTITSSGSLDALQMPSETCRATVRGSGDLFLHCDSLLIAEITSSGDIWYTGNPEIDELDTGSGDLKMY